MTDQAFEDKVQQIASEMRESMRRVEDDYPDGEFLMDMSDYIRDLDKLCARARPRPTLADMDYEEREACQWMQADVENLKTRYVILTPCDHNGSAVMASPSGRVVWFRPHCVTPRPDLARLEWPDPEGDSDD